MQNGNDFDPVREDHIVNYVSELSKARGAHVFPNDAVQLWRRLDSFEHIAQPGDKALSKSFSNKFVIVTDLLDVCLRKGSEYYRETHGALSLGPKTSRHGRPSFGRSRASWRRLANSARCHSGTSAGPRESGRLSQIC